MESFQNFIIPKLKKIGHWAGTCIFLTVDFSSSKATGKGTDKIANMEPWLKHVRLINSSHKYFFKLKKKTAW